MLIQTKRRQPECPIPLPHKNAKGETIAETVYFFKPSDPLDAKHSPHIAEVSDAEHVRMLLRLDHYSPYTGDAPKELTLARTTLAAPAAVTAVQPVHKDAEDEAPAALPAGLSEVEGIVALSTRQLREAIAAGGVSPDALRQAVAAERATSAPRNAWIAIATAHLGAL